MHNFNKKLDLLLNDFKNGKSLARPIELSKLAEKVVNQKQQRDKEDIELWAEDLSKDFAKYSD